MSPAEYGEPGNLVNEQTAKDYLLVRLTDEARDAFEERMFMESGFFDWLQAVEWELIEDYLEGRLNELDLRQFKEVYADSPERGQQIQLMRSVLRASKSGSVLNWTSAALLAAMLLVGVGIGALAQRSIQPRTQEIATTPLPGRMADPVLDLELFEGRQRGRESSAQSLDIPAHAVVVRLHFNLSTPASKPCRVEITGDDLQNAIALPALSGGDGTVTTELATATLPSGDFIARVHCSGAHVGAFPLRLIRSR